MFLTATLVGLVGHIVSLTAGSMDRYSKMRIQSALIAREYKWPHKTPSLKSVGHNDIALAMQVLKDTRQLPEVLHDVPLIGELSLDGEVRHVRGVIAYVKAAKKAGYKHIVVPESDAREAALIKGITIVPAMVLDHVIDFVTKGLVRYVPSPLEASPDHRSFDEVPGRQGLKKAIEAALKDNLSLLIIGSERRVLEVVRHAPACLPSLGEEAEEVVTTQFSVAGLLGYEKPCRPFRAPHYTISSQGIGGAGSLRIGELGLANEGLLYLEHVNEFSKATLDTVNFARRDKAIKFNNLTTSYEIPADFRLLAQCDSCCCGSRDCKCTLKNKQLYQKHLQRYEAMFDLVYRMDV